MITIRTGTVALPECTLLGPGTLPNGKYRREKCEILAEANDSYTIRVKHTDGRLDESEVMTVEKELVDLE